MFKSVTSSYSDLAGALHAYGTGYHTRDPWSLMALGGVIGGTAGAIIPGSIYGGISEDKSVWEGIKTMSPYMAAYGVSHAGIMKNISNNYVRGLNDLGAEKARSMTAYDIGMHGKSLRSSFFSGFKEKF